MGRRVSRSLSASHPPSIYAQVKLWDAPDGRGGVIGQLSKGTTVRIEDVSETGKWTKVSCFRPDGSELSGWVLKRCLGDGCDVETFESSRPERRTLIIEEEVDDLETAGGGRRRAKDLNRKGRFYNRLVYPDVVPPVKQAAPEGVNPAANAHAPTIGRLAIIRILLRRSFISRKLPPTAPNWCFPLVIFASPAAGMYSRNRKRSGTSKPRTDSARTPPWWKRSRSTSIALRAPVVCVCVCVWWGRVRECLYSGVETFTVCAARSKDEQR